MLVETDTDTPRPHAGPKPRGGGGARGGSAPLEKFEPPLGCAVPFAVTIGIEVYPPLEFCQPPPANDTWLRRCTAPLSGSVSFFESSNMVTLIQIRF